MFSNPNDRASRDRVVDDLKKKIRDEKRVLERRVELTEQAPDADDRPYRAKRLSEVFESMGF